MRFCTTAFIAALLVGFGFAQDETSYCKAERPGFNGSLTLVIALPSEASLTEAFFYLDAYGAGFDGTSSAEAIIQKAYHYIGAENDGTLHVQLTESSMSGTGDIEAMSLVIPSLSSSVSFATTPIFPEAVLELKQLPFGKIRAKLLNLESFESFQYK
jgi:hypothetical protein